MRILDSFKLKQDNNNNRGIRSEDTVNRHQSSKDLVNDESW